MASSELPERVIALLEDASQTGDSYRLFEWFLVHQSYLENLDSVYLKLGDDISELTNKLPEGDLKLSNTLKIFLDLIQAYGINDKTCIQIAKPLLFLAVDEKCPFVNLKRAVTVFNLLLLSNAVIASIVSDESLEGSLQILGRKVPTIGDYEVQATIFEAMFRLSVSNREIWANIWFLDATVKKMFLNIDPKQFEPNCRKALNYMNRHEEDRKVYSFIANSVTFGYIQLKEPSGCDFWIDFNYESESISFYCSELSESASSSESCSLWETILIGAESVVTYQINYKESGKSKELVLDLKYPCHSLIASSHITNPALESYKVVISFWGILDLLQHLERIYGKEKHAQNKPIEPREKCSDSITFIPSLEESLEEHSKVLKKRKIFDTKEAIEVAKRISEACSSEILSAKSYNAYNPIPIEDDIPEGNTGTTPLSNKVSDLVCPILVSDNEAENSYQKNSCHQKISDLSSPLDIRTEQEPEHIPPTYDNQKLAKVSGTSEVIRLDNLEVLPLNMEEKVQKSSKSADAILCNDETINHESYDIIPPTFSTKVSISSVNIHLTEKSVSTNLKGNRIDMKSKLNFKAVKKFQKTANGKQRRNSKSEFVNVQDETGVIATESLNKTKKFKGSLRQTSKSDQKNANCDAFERTNQNSGEGMRLRSTSRISKSGMHKMQNFNDTPEEIVYTTRTSLDSNKLDKIVHESSKGKIEKLTKTEDITFTPGSVGDKAISKFNDKPRLLENSEMCMQKSNESAVLDNSRDIFQDASLDLKNVRETFKINCQEASLLLTSKSVTPVEDHCTRKNQNTNGNIKKKESHKEQIIGKEVSPEKDFKLTHLESSNKDTNAYEVSKNQLFTSSVNRNEGFSESVSKDPVVLNKKVNSLRSKLNDPEVQENTQFLAMESNNPQKHVVTNCLQIHSDVSADNSQKRCRSRLRVHNVPSDEGTSDYQISSPDLFPAKKATSHEVATRSSSRKKKSLKKSTPQSPSSNHKPSQNSTRLQPKRSLKRNAFSENGKLKTNRSTCLSPSLISKKELTQVDAGINKPYDEPQQIVIDFDSSKTQSRKVRLFNLDKAPVYDGPVLNDACRLSPEHFVGKSCLSTEEKGPGDHEEVEEVIPDTLDENLMDGLKDHEEKTFGSKKSVENPVEDGKIDKSLTLYEIFPDSEEEFQPRSIKNKKTEDHKRAEQAEMPPLDDLKIQSAYQHLSPLNNAALNTQKVELSKKRRNAAVRSSEKNKKLFDAVSEVEFDKGDTDTGSMFRSKIPINQKKKKRERSITDTETGSSDVSWMRKKKPCPLFETPKKKYSDLKQGSKKKVQKSKKKLESKAPEPKGKSDKEKLELWSDIEKHQLTIERSAKRGAGRIMKALESELSASSSSKRSPVRRNLQPYSPSHAEPKSPNKMTENEGVDDICLFEEPADHASPLHDTAFIEGDNELTGEGNILMSPPKIISSEKPNSKLLSSKKDSTYDSSFQSVSKKMQLRNKTTLKDSGLELSLENQLPNDNFLEVNLIEQPELEVHDSGFQDVAGFNRLEDENHGKQFIMDQFLDSVTDYIESVHESTSIHNESGPTASKKSRTVLKKSDHIAASTDFPTPKHRKRKNETLDTKDTHKPKKRNLIEPHEHQDAPNPRQNSSKLNETKVSGNLKSGTQQVIKKDTNLKPMPKRKSKAYKSCLTPNKVDDLCKRLNKSIQGFKSPPILQSTDSINDTITKLKDDSNLSSSPTPRGSPRKRKKSEDRSFGTHDSYFTCVTTDSSLDEFPEKAWFENICFDLSKDANLYTRKLLATVQKCVQEYSYKMQILRKNIAASVKTQESLGKAECRSELLTSINKCKALRKEIEKSLSKMRRIGQEYVDAEMMYCRKIKSKHIKASRKYIFFMKEAEEKAITRLEENVLSQTKFFLKQFRKNIEKG